jgi:hypothetical protein
LLLTGPIQSDQIAVVCAYAHLTEASDSKREQPFRFRNSKTSSHILISDFWLVDEQVDACWSRTYSLIELLTALEGLLAHAAMYSLSFAFFVSPARGAMQRGT